MNIVTFNALGRYGRLCNQMYQVAGVIGIARRNGFEYKFPYWKNWDHLERFHSDEDIDIQRHFVNPLPLYEGPILPDYPVEWGYHEVRLARSVSISGHLQSTKYFEHCLDEVRFYLTMKDEPPSNDYVAIHWRAGDYSSDGGYHPRMDMRYFEPAMKLFPNRKFLVFSDDIPAAKSMFGSGVEYSEGRDYLEDFKLLKRCHSFIISNSSYSAMAAVLANALDKKVVAPRPWFGPKYAQINGEDIYEPDWVVINYE